MKIIAIWNLKGGIGKTTTAVNFAYNLVQKNHKVLFVDIDQQGNASSLFRKYNLTKDNVYQVIAGNCDINKAIKKTLFSGLHIIPSDIRLANIASVETDALKAVLSMISTDYDYCIIDCPPAADTCTRLALMAAGEVIIPVPATRWGKEGLNMVIELIKEINPSASIAGILFTMFKKNFQSMKNIRNMMWDYYEHPVFDTAITKTEDVISAENRKKPIAVCRSKSAAAEDYKNFTDEYLRREEQRCPV